MKARLAAALVLALPGAAQAQAPAPSPPPPPPPPAEPPRPVFPAVETLSRPGQVSRYAFVVRRTIARRVPDPRAAAVARVRLRTQDRTDELLMVLERTHDAAGRAWLRVRLPILPNNSTGWVPEDAMGRLRRSAAWLVVDRRRLRATLIRHGRAVFRARVGIGKRRWPTPPGQYYVRNRLSGYTNPMYGPLAFGLNARSTVLTDWPGGGFVGIHGTDQPHLLPGRVSHGCIRMRNRDILRLDRLMPVGSPVTVR